MKLALFLFVNFIGFLTGGLMTVFAITNNLIPDLSNDALANFRLLFMGGTMGVWILSAAISVTYLFVSSNLKYLFLALPIILPLAYAVAVLNLYSV